MPGVLGRKLFCTHWLRTGQCDFIQQGCAYVHKIPDLSTMEKLQLREYPRWFREQSIDYQRAWALDFDPAGLGNSHRQNSTSNQATPNNSTHFSPSENGSRGGHRSFGAIGVNRSGSGNYARKFEPYPTKRKTHPISAVTAQTAQLFSGQCSHKRRSPCTTATTTATVQPTFAPPHLCLPRHGLALSVVVTAPTATS
jgi:hypothetical protein